MCLGIAFLLFLLTRSLINPTIIPNNGSEKQTTIVDRLCSQKGIDSEASTGKDSPVNAPARKSDIPSALKSFFTRGGFEASAENNSWLLTRRFANSDYSRLIPNIGDGGPKVVDVYSFLLTPNTFVVFNRRGFGSLILVMKQESGLWKIDNIIVPIYRNSFLDMNEINWDCKPHFDYE